MCALCKNLVSHLPMSSRLGTLMCDYNVRTRRHHFLFNIAPNAQVCRSHPPKGNDMSAAEWYIFAGNRQQGPFTSEQIRAFVNSGKLKPSMGIKKEGMADFVPAQFVQGLFKPAAPAPRQRLHLRPRRPQNQPTKSRWKRSLKILMMSTRPLKHLTIMCSTSRSKMWSKKCRGRRS